MKTVKFSPLKCFAVYGILLGMSFGTYKVEDDFWHVYVPAATCVAIKNRHF